MTERGYLRCPSLLFPASFVCDRSIFSLLPPLAHWLRAFSITRTLFPLRRKAHPQSRRRQRFGPRRAASMIHIIGPDTVRAVVLDANVLRNKEIVEACFERFKRTREPIAFPEMALFEATKNAEHWEDTVKNSLRYISQWPEAVVIARSSLPLGLREEASGIPTTSVVDDALSELFRRVLRDIKGGGGGDLTNMLEAMRRHRQQFEHEKHAVDSHETMKILKSIGRLALPPDLTRQIARELASGNRINFQNLLCEKLQFSMQRDAHVRRGVLAQYADALMEAPSVTYLFALGMGVLGLRWTVEGGVESARPARVANDVIDTDYVLAAFWAGRIITHDARARAYVADLKAVASAWWPNYASWFERVSVPEPTQVLAHLCST